MAKYGAKYDKYFEVESDWVDILPTTWKFAPLRYLVKRVSTGGTPSDPSSFTDNNEVPWYAPGDFDDSGILKCPSKWVTRVACQKGDARLYRSGSVVVVGIGATLGKVAYADQDFSCNQQLNVIETGSKLLALYLRYVLIVQQDQMRQISNASTIGIMNQDKTKSIRVPLPSITEQRMIVRFLDHETTKIDTLIEKQQQLIKLLKEKRQAIISHAVTKGLNPNAPMRDSGVEWLGEVPEHWDVCQARHLFKGGTKNGLYKSADSKSPEGVPFIQMGEAFRDRVYQSGASERVLVDDAELEAWGLLEGDLLFARRSIVIEGSGRCTRIGEISEPHIFESSMIRVRPEKTAVDPAYLHYAFDSSSIRAQILATTKTVTISGIDSGQLKSVKLMVPPLEEQRTIVEVIESRVKSFDAAERKSRQLIELLNERRTALISAAVTGKIDVRDWQAPTVESLSEPLHEAAS